MESMNYNDNTKNKNLNIIDTLKESFSLFRLSYKKAIFLTILYEIFAIGGATLLYLNKIYTNLAINEWAL